MASTFLTVTSVCVCVCVLTHKHECVCIRAEIWVKYSGSTRFQDSTSIWHMGRISTWLGGQLRDSMCKAPSSLYNSVSINNNNKK